jgi:hypothetical protein
MLYKRNFQAITCSADLGSDDFYLEPDIATLLAPTTYS